MAIIKSKHAGNYTVIPNEIFKSGLSVEAIGMICYLLSLPQDWVIYKTKLHEQMNLGREKTDRIFKELQSAGYVCSAERHKSDGSFEWEHIVYDKPYNGEPNTGFTGTANTQLINTNIINTNNKININNTAEASSAEYKSAFTNLYATTYGTEYYWTAKDAAHLRQLIAKVVSKCRDVRPDATDKQALEAFKYYLTEAKKDSWVAQNFSVAILNSKFNEIFSKLKLKKNGESKFNN